MTESDEKDLNVCIKCNHMFCAQYANGEPCPGFAMAPRGELQLRAGWESVIEVLAEPLF